MPTNPLSSVGNQVRVYTEASEMQRVSREEAPPKAKEEEPPPPGDMKAEAERSTRLKDDAEDQAERQRERRLEANPMSWEVGRRMDRYA